MGQLKFVESLCIGCTVLLDICNHKLCQTWNSESWDANVFFPGLSGRLCKALPGCIRLSDGTFGVHIHLLNMVPHLCSPRGTFLFPILFNSQSYFENHLLPTLIGVPQSFCLVNFSFIFPGSCSCPFFYYIVQHSMTCSPIFAISCE